MHSEALALVVVTTLHKALGPVAERLTHREQASAEHNVRLVEHNARLVGLHDEVEGLRKTLDALADRPPEPGPKGADGRDGVDGITLDDIAVEYDGARTLAFRFTRGAEVKTIPITLPFLKFAGVYAEGVAYVCGDVVTHAGSSWHCQRPTVSRPGDGAGAWQLMVKKGRDLKPRDGAHA